MEPFEAFEKFALAAYRCGEFFSGVTVAVLVAWVRWRSPWRKR